MPSVSSIRHSLTNKSPYFFTNAKTSGISVDFRVCKFMKKEGNVFKSSLCHGCYSATILTVYSNLAKKIQNLPQQDSVQLELFEQTCKDIHSKYPEIKKLRFYALSDFHSDDIDFILVAKKYFIVDIISKTLTLPNYRKDLKTLINISNVWISLSFNSQFIRHAEQIKTLLKEKNARNVQLNYTLNYKEDDPTDTKYQDFTVLHFKNKLKRKGMSLYPLPETRLCAVFDAQGNPVEGHGVCNLCNNCHLSFLDWKDGKKPSPPEKISPVLAKKSLAMR